MDGWEKRPRLKERNGGGNAAVPRPEVWRHGDHEIVTVPVFEFSVVGHEPRPWGVGKWEWMMRAGFVIEYRSRRVRFSDEATVQEIADDRLTGD